MFAGGGFEAVCDGSQFSDEGLQRDRTGCDSGRISRGVTAGQPEAAETEECGEGSRPDQPNEYLIHGHHLTVSQRGGDNQQAVIGV
jgi:hypothetical protein